MARYRKISIKMHGDEKFRRLSPIPPCGQGLWWHLLAGKQTGIIPGICSIGERAFAEQLRWPLEAFREAFQEVSNEGMAKADWEAQFLWVPNAIRYNKPESPNVIKSWRDEWEELPECPLKEEAWNELSTYISTLSEAFRKAFEEACPKPSAKPFVKPSAKAMANQEQEQEQEQEQDLEAFSLRSKTSCPELSTGDSSSPEPPAFEIPTNKNGETFSISQEQVEEWAKLFPSVDIEAELRKMIAWSKANTVRRKTRQGMLRFAVNWLSRCQDQGGKAVQATGAGNREPPISYREKVNRAAVAGFLELHNDE